jgi:hypothetical protein
MTQPEESYIVSMSGNQVRCTRPDGVVEAIELSDLDAVYIETNDSGPVGIDVWWIPLGSDPQGGCVYPLGATGEQRVLERLKQLPGFEIQGMNSTSNQRFLCWKRGEATGNGA